MNIPKTAVTFTTFYCSNILYTVPATCENNILYYRISHPYMFVYAAFATHIFFTLYVPLDVDLPYRVSELHPYSRHVAFGVPAASCTIYVPYIPEELGGKIRKRKTTYTYTVYCTYNVYRGHYSR
jgi:hypothetical protein